MSTVCLAGSKGLQATVRRCIKGRWLGTSGHPGFHPRVIQVYVIFAVTRDAAFHLRLESNQRPIAWEAIAQTIELLQTCEDVGVSVASPPFGRQNTTHLLSFTCRLIDRSSGSRASRPVPLELRSALAGKARTRNATPYPSRVTNWYDGGQHHLFPSRAPVPPKGR